MVASFVAAADFYCLFNAGLKFFFLLNYWPLLAGNAWLMIVFCRVIVPPSRR
jgi:hypothetical protein